MGTKTSIEWTRGEDGTEGATWTPIRARNIKTGKVGWHCEHATAGCEFCYAEGFNKRLGTGLPFKPGHRKDVEIFLDDKMLLVPFKWKAPRRIFVCSMTDLFADFVPDDFIDRMFAVMALCPQHTFQILSKRADRMKEYCSSLRDRAVEIAQRAVWLGIWDDPDVAACDTVTAIDDGPLPNCWMGVSAERQQEANERIPLLLQTPAAVRFVSAEPLIGSIDLMMLRSGDKVIDAVQGCVGYSIGDGEFEGATPCAKLDWVIAGSESGPHARPCDIAWVRSLRDQCSGSGTAFFWKQHAENGRKIPVPKLDGRQWMEFPVGA